MAEMFVVPVARKLVNLLAVEARLPLEIHNEARSVRRELEIIQLFLRDAEAKSERGELSGAIKLLLRQMREDADRVEDVVDKYLYHVEHRRRRSGGLFGCVRKATRWVQTFKPRYDMVCEIRDIKASLREIKERGQSYGLASFDGAAGSSGGARDDDKSVDPRTIGSLFVDDNELVGIDSVSKELLEKTIKGPSDRTVISLVGEGGVGKTTLAKKVYDDALLKGHFECRVWVTVSQSRCTDAMLKRMMIELFPTTVHVEQNITIEDLVRRLKYSLKDKRYMVVFDDVWREDFWDAVKLALPSNKKGSRIIVTTRKNAVADCFKETECDVVKKIKCWSETEALKLFRKKVFAESNGECPEDLVNLCSEIVKTCQGLPLAIVVVAGLMSKREKTELEWKRALSLQNLKKGLQGNPKFRVVSEVLRPSYFDLPYHLKLCFLYFGIFPPNYFPVFGEKLCQLWIAEGFIEPRGDMALEKIADQCLTELIDRNLVQSEVRYGYDRWCRVHNLVHDTILDISNELGFNQIFSEAKLRLATRRNRRLSIDGTTENFMKSIGDSGIRSVFLFNAGESPEGFAAGLFERFKLLKVLDFSYTPLDNLPKQVGNCFHLKYLTLRGTKVKMLPKSVGKLRNLQTLDVRDTLVRELPEEMNKLTNLRHILAFTFDGMVEYSLRSYSCGVKIHKRIGRSEELQTLTCVVLNSSVAKELGKLRKLKCLYVSNVTNEVAKVLGESVGKMKELEEFHLTSSSADDEEGLDLKGVISFPEKLFMRGLQLNCRLKQLPSWVVQLNNLQRLDLNFSKLPNEALQSIKNFPQLSFLRLYEAYDGDHLHFETEGFMKLKHLRLRKLAGLKTVRIDEGALPLLEQLGIGPFPLMKRIFPNIQNLPKLKYLEVYDMPKEFVKALQPVDGEEALQEDDKEALQPVDDEEALQPEEDKEALQPVDDEEALRTNEDAASQRPKEGDDACNQNKAMKKTLCSQIMTELGNKRKVMKMRLRYQIKATLDGRLKMKLRNKMKAAKTRLRKGTRTWLLNRIKALKAMKQGPLRPNEGEARQPNEGNEIEAVQPNEGHEIEDVQPDAGNEAGAEQPCESIDHDKIKHIPSVRFWYRVQGLNYSCYNLGSLELKQLLLQQPRSG